MPPAEGEIPVRGRVSASTVLRSGAKFPSPPQFGDGEDRKPCPLCRKIFFKPEFESVLWWKNHVNDDLFPFACISSTCSESPTFASRSEWIAHTERDHGVFWSRGQSIPNRNVQNAPDPKVTSNVGQPADICPICCLPLDEPRDTRTGIHQPTTVPALQTLNEPPENLPLNSGDIESKNSYSRSKKGQKSVHFDLTKQDSEPTGEGVGMPTTNTEAMKTDDCGTQKTANTTMLKHIADHLQFLALLTQRLSTAKLAVGDVQVFSSAQENSSDGAPGQRSTLDDEFEFPEGNEGNETDKHGILQDNLSPEAGSTTKSAVSHRMQKELRNEEMEAAKPIGWSPVTETKQDLAGEKVVDLWPELFGNSALYNRSSVSNDDYLSDERLKPFIARLEPAPSSDRPTRSPNRGDSAGYTIGWICAISTEFVAAQAFLDEVYEGPESVSVGDNNSYALGRVGKHNVVVAVAPYGEYGIHSATNVARDMIHSFPNIRIGLMVGIAGGVPSSKHDIRLGDVVVSASHDGGVFWYNFGKMRQNQDFQATRFLDQPPELLQTAVTALRLQYIRNGHRLKETIYNVLEKKPRLRKKYGPPDLSTDRLYLSALAHPPSDERSCAEVCSQDPSELVFRAPRTKGVDDPAIHYGLIASANHVVKDAKVRVIAEEQGFLCLDMEGAGLMNHFPCLVIRGICDYSDSHKNKEWQGYAAMAAAAYAKDLLHQIALNDVEAEKPIAELLSESLPLTLDQLDKLIGQYGPILHLHPDEQYFNTSVEDFLHHSTLVDKKAGIHAMSPSPDSLPQKGDDDQYFLALAPQGKRGDFGTAKAYVRAFWQPGMLSTDIQFWFFNTCKGPATLHINGLIFNSITTARDVGVEPLGEHVGDWEMCMLRVDNITTKVIGIWLSQYTKGQFFSGDQIDQSFTFQGSQPKIYASLNGHANFSCQGSNPSKHRKINGIPIGIEFFIRNDTSEKGKTLDCSKKYEIVSADWLSVPTPKWVTYPFRWGPEGIHTRFSLITVADIVRSAAGAEFVKFLPVAALSVIAGELLPFFVEGDINGPAPPSRRGSWMGTYPVY